MDAHQILSSLTTADHLLERARDRYGVVVDPSLSPLFARGCIEPGLMYHCNGRAALSVVCALVGAATQTNTWAAFVDVSFLNMDAAADLGVALHRVVSITCPSSVTGSQHTQVLEALVEGCDLVVVQSPRCTAAGARSVAMRAKRSGASVFIVGTHCFSIDATLTSRINKWNFDDRFSSRTVAIDIHHRRSQRVSSVNVVLPNTAGAVSAVV